jgi:hypothetical protein
MISWPANKRPENAIDIVCLANRSPLIFFRGGLVASIPMPIVTLWGILNHTHETT